MRTKITASSIAVIVLASTSTNPRRRTCCDAFQPSLFQERRRASFHGYSLHARHESQEQENTTSNPSDVRLFDEFGIEGNREEGISRRKMLASLVSGFIFLPGVAKAVDDAQQKSLEDLELGKGQWMQLKQTGGSSRVLAQEAPAVFSTYLARYLINFDRGVAAWWSNEEASCALVSEDQRKTRLGRSFASFAASIQLAANEFVKGQPTAKEGYEKLLQRLLENYGSQSEAQRHICLLFATLPSNRQPTDSLRRILKSNPESLPINTLSEEGTLSIPDDFTSLLPAGFQCASINEGSAFAIRPPISLYAVGLDEEFGQSATATPFGPLSSNALVRELPTYSPDIYALFGISGATGCALTHSVVIPLDVVKTKAQTDPDDYSDIIVGATKILKDEGLSGLLTGAQATLAGYFWYGLSVYPSYTFFKRYIGQELLPLDFAVAHANDIALVAGALAAVIASLGLTPLEAARIRVVADPERYRPLGLFGTLDVIAKENPAVDGLQSLYAGLPSLMTRQVIFGSVKFLAFERACEAIYFVWPFLRDATWTALTVSLVAGGFSGALSSVVSQPADAVLTYVAQKNDGKGSLGVLEGCRLMVEESGMSSLFRGLGSRCLWAGSIIAGQFLLYDVFRNYFGVNVEDLSQVFHVDIS